MKTNMGTLDRGARLVIAFALLIAAFATDALAGGVLQWLAIVVAVVFAVTALVGVCPLYSLVGIKTCRSS